MKSCVIFAGGDKVSENAVDFQKVENSLVICADKGFVLAKSLGITPHILMGDFDSLDIENRDTKNVRVKSFPPEKDDTDLMLAIKEGFLNGCDDFTIYGALGGRFDHTFAVIQSLGYIVSHGAKGCVISDNEKIEMLSSGKYTINKISGRYFSLFAFSQKVENLTIKGTKYDVEKVTLTSDFPLGVSNEISGNSAEISFDEGMLLTIHSQKN